MQLEFTVSSQVSLYKHDLPGLSDWNASKSKPKCKNRCSFLWPRSTPFSSHFHQSFLTGLNKTGSKRVQSQPWNSRCWFSFSRYQSNLFTWSFHNLVIKWYKKSSPTISCLYFKESRAFHSLASVIFQIFSFSYYFWFLQLFIIYVWSVWPLVPTYSTIQPPLMFLYSHFINSSQYPAFPSFEPCSNLIRALFTNFELRTSFGRSKTATVIHQPSRGRQSIFFFLPVLQLERVKGTILSYILATSLHLFGRNYSELLSPSWLQHLRVKYTSDILASLIIIFHEA